MPSKEIAAELADALGARQAWAMDAVLWERRRQDTKWGVAALQEQSFDKRLTILVEEVGEVAKAILERDEDGLETELVHVAAVAVATLEMLLQRQRVAEGAEVEVW